MDKTEASRLESKQERMRERVRRKKARKQQRKEWLAAIAARNAASGDSRKEARLKGATVYRARTPCAQGHLGFRGVSSGACLECIKDGYRRNRRDPAFVVWEGAKCRSKRNDVLFKITKKDIRAVWPVDNCCPVFHTEFERGEGRTLPTSATLDRIRPERGYVVGNIAVISFKANVMKGNETRPEAFRHLANWLEGALVLVPQDSSKEREQGQDVQAL